MSNHTISRTTARTAVKHGYDIIGTAMTKIRPDGSKVFIQRRPDNSGWAVGRTLTTAKPVTHRTFTKAIKAAEILFDEALTEDDKKTMAAIEAQNQED